MGCYIGRRNIGKSTFEKEVNMVQCKYDPDITCMKVNSFPKGGKVHERCLLCEHLDKDIQISILANSFMYIIEEECCIYNQDAAYEIARARLAREEWDIHYVKNYTI